MFAPTLFIGDRVRAEWLDHTKTERSVVGKVTDLRGNNPITADRIRVQPEDGGEEVVVRPEWIVQVWPGS